MVRQETVSSHHEHDDQWLDKDGVDGKLCLANWPGHKRHNLNRPPFKADHEESGNSQLGEEPQLSQALSRPPSPRLPVEVAQASVGYDHQRSRYIGCHQTDSCTRVCVCACVHVCVCVRACVCTCMCGQGNTGDTLRREHTYDCHHAIYIYPQWNTSTIKQILYLTDCTPRCPQKTRSPWRATLMTLVSRPTTANIHTIPCMHGRHM